MFPLVYLWEKWWNFKLCE